MLRQFASGEYSGWLYDKTYYEFITRTVIAVRMRGLSGDIHTIQLRNHPHGGQDVSITDVQADAEGLFWTANCDKSFVALEHPYVIVLIVRQ